MALRGQPRARGSRYSFPTSSGRNAVRHPWAGGQTVLHWAQASLSGWQGPPVGVRWRPEVGSSSVRESRAQLEGQFGAQSWQTGGQWSPARRRAWFSRVQGQGGSPLKKARDCEKAGCTFGRRGVGGASEHEGGSPRLMRSGLDGGNPWRCRTRGTGQRGHPPALRNASQWPERVSQRPSNSGPNPPCKGRIYVFNLPH